MATEKLLQAVMVAAELTGAEFSKAAAAVFAKRLGSYPEHQALAALDRCVEECKHRLTLADVVSRIDDGRPGAEEAWAAIPKDESTSVVWTQEMAEAFRFAGSLIDAGDMIAARMAFIEKYKKLLSHARSYRQPIVWTASLGHDPAYREDVIRQAHEVGRLTTAQAKNYLPHFEKDQKLISAEKRDMVKNMIAGLKNKREVK